MVGWRSVLPGSSTVRAMGLVPSQVSFPLMLQGYKTDYCGIVSNGFTLYEYKYSKLNYNGAQFYYIAFR